MTPVVDAVANLVATYNGIDVEAAGYIVDPVEAAAAYANAAEGSAEQYVLAWLVKYNPVPPAPTPAPTTRSRSSSTSTPTE
jgi:hypothetical protein